MDPVTDWRSRTKLLYGDIAASRIASSTVLVAGLGAVGSFAVEALARNGVGKLILVDFDEVEPSNINRQLYALMSTVGRAKTDVARERVADINPDCEIVTLQVKIPSAANEISCLFSNVGICDVIVDAIDDVEAKTALIEYGLANKIPVVSSMGAARRVDPSLVRTGTLKDVTGCPLAKCVRKSLRTRLEPVGILLDVLPAERLCCVYSKEPPRPQISAPEFGPRAMGSSICVTGTFGLAAASAALSAILYSES